MRQIADNKTESQSEAEQSVPDTHSDLANNESTVAN